MGNRTDRTQEIVDSSKLGVSFSYKTCRDYGIDYQKVLKALIELGFRRFRLMSYWDLHEPIEDKRNFSVLDRQLKIIEKAGCRASLCLGMRQPRWPETHLPGWAMKLSETERAITYMDYQREVINRYKSNNIIESWQLENEFWNRNFGTRGNFSRDRLVAEYEQVRVLDPGRPLIMSLGNTIGLPLGKPKPDLFGTTIYLSRYQEDKYTHSKLPAWYFRSRRKLIKLIGRRDLVIHELQAEPWGPKANWEMTDEEQAKSMNPKQLAKNFVYASRTGMKYMDLWGGEWWYWRKTKFKDDALWETLRAVVNKR